MKLSVYNNDDDGDDDDDDDDGDDDGDDFPMWYFVLFHSISTSSYFYIMYI